MPVTCKPCSRGVLTVGRQPGRGAGTELLCLGSRWEADVLAVTDSRKLLQGYHHLSEEGLLWCAVRRGKQWYSGLRGGTPAGGQAPRASRGKNGGTAHSAVKKIGGTKGNCGAMVSEGAASGSRGGGRHIRQRWVGRLSGEGQGGAVRFRASAAHAPRPAPRIRSANKAK